MASEIRVTNIKANDGTASLTVANSTGALTTTGNATVGGTLTSTVAINADVINEKTSANGVLIDGLKVKDYSLMYGSNIGLTISSDGYVTKPNLPAFVAEANNSGGYTSTSGAFPANYANHNQGNHYNTSNYRFTAPLDGVYLFTFSSLSSNTSNTSRPQFFVNGSSGHNTIQHGISNVDGNGSNSNTTSSLIKLSASDYVTVQSNNGHLYYYGSSHSTFSGCLIG